jgi:hypothetical protein
VAYRIILFQNSSLNQGVTRNPANSRDNYELPPNRTIYPTNSPLINKTNGRSAKNFTEALVWANSISTGVLDYCFWDSGKSEIFGVTQQDPNEVIVLYKGSGGYKKLTVKSDGKIEFMDPSPLDRLNRLNPYGNLIRNVRDWLGGN